MKVDFCLYSILEGESEGTRFRAQIREEVLSSRRRSSDNFKTINGDRGFRLDERRFV